MPGDLRLQKAIQGALGMLDFGFWILDCMDERIFQRRTKAIALSGLKQRCHG
jgi:hypothetical protein